MYSWISVAPYMINSIKKLREKPESHRRRWQVGLTLVIMAIIVAGWAFVFSNRISLAISGQSSGENSIASPFDTIKNDLTANIEQIKEGYLILKGKK